MPSCITVNLHTKEIVMREFGINLRATTAISDEAYIKTVAELGFTTIFDMARPKEEITRLFALCDACGLRYETLHAPFDGINAIWKDNDDGDRMLKQLLDGVDKCCMVNAPILVVHLSSGIFPPSTTDIGRGRFAKLVEYAMQKDIKIAFENQRKLFNLAWAMETFGPETGVGFCWDCGHEGCFTPGKQFMPLFGDRLICTHIHDNPGFFNDDRHMLPFDGNLDFNRIAGQLREYRWQGSLMLEVSAKNHAEYAEKYSPEEFLRRAAASVKRLSQMI